MGAMPSARLTARTFVGVFLALGTCATAADEPFEPVEPLRYQEFVPSVPEATEAEPGIPDEQIDSECDSGPQELLHPDCPDQVPGLGACESEGLECLYDAGNGCAFRFDCMLGFWTPLGEQCPVEDDLHTAYSSESCSSAAPIPGSPCESPTLQCGYGQCPRPGDPEREYRCVCGRWGFREECYTLP